MSAFFAMSEFHKEQRRKSGQLYVIHPIQVATIVASVGSDLETIMAALLHDTVEDTDATLDDILNRFGEEVEALVEAVTHQPMFSSKEFMEKIYTKARRDPRVACIKLADQIANHRNHSQLVFSPERHREHIEEMENFYLAQLATIPDLPKELTRSLQRVTDASWEDYNNRTR
jgi:GTP pyrophosphokinase